MTRANSERRPIPTVSGHELSRPRGTHSEPVVSSGRDGKENRRIWFMLTNTEGAPYGGSRSATKIRIDPSVEDVDDFRTLIHRTYVSNLEGVTNDMLLVYRNESAVTSGSSLDSGLLLDGLGQSSVEALIIVVPDPITPPRQMGPPSAPHSDSLKEYIRTLTTQRGFYTVCKNPFFIELPKAEENGRWLHLLHQIPDGLKLDRLYIRDCYRSLLDNVITEDPVKKTIITGTPGIGKSIFLIYLLWKLIRSRKRVIFVYHPYSVFFDGKGGVFETIPFEVPRYGEIDPSDHESPLWTKETYCLFDGGEMQPQLAGVPYNSCPFVYSRSPRNDSTNELEKVDPNRIVKTYYMPRWSYDEIREVSALFPKASEWERCLDILGPIPRLVFQADGNVSLAKELVERAAENSDMVDLIYEVGKRDGILGQKKSVVHKAVHYMSEEPYESFWLVFASDFAIRSCFDVHKKVLRRRWEDTLTAYTKNSFTGQICGYAFQEHALQLLMAGGEFQIHTLLPNKQRGPEQKLVIKKSPKGIINTDCVRESDLENVLYVPRSKTYADIDAWIPGVGGIQITLNKSHDFKGDQFRIDSPKLGRGTGKLYWAIPQQHYEDFTGKSAAGAFVQYAMMIPDPNHIAYEKAIDSHIP